VPNPKKLSEELRATPKQRLFHEKKRFFGETAGWHPEVGYRGGVERINSPHWGVHPDFPPRQRP
jgi:hypothetical protein